MEIIFVCTKSITFNTFLKSQANYLERRGLKVRIACSDIENLDFKKKNVIKIDFPTNYIHLINLLKYFKVFFEIRDLVKKNKSSIFYLHTPVASYLFRLFTLFYNLKIIYFVHGFRFTSKTSFFRGIILKLIEKFLSLKTKIFITINKEDYNYAKNNLLKKVPIYKLNGVGLDLTDNLRKKIKNKKGINKIIVIGAYKKSKGYLDLLKIVELLKYQKIKIDCYGYGDHKKFKLIKIQKKLKNISFRRFDKNLKKKIKKYDLFIHLSKREGLPVSVMECLTEGVPVICKNIRGNNDLIKDRFNGFFVKSFEEVIYKIFYLKIENKIFNEMRINAINSINKSFSKKHINSQIYKIISNNFIR